MRDREFVTGPTQVKYGKKSYTTARRSSDEPAASGTYDFLIGRNPHCGLRREECAKKMASEAAGAFSFNYLQVPAATPTCRCLQLCTPAGAYSYAHLQVSAATCTCKCLQLYTLAGVWSYKYLQALAAIYTWRLKKPAAHTCRYCGYT